MSGGRNRSPADGDQKGQENDEDKMPRRGHWTRVRRFAGRPWQRRAADEWFVLGEKVLKATDPSTEIKAEAGKFWKEDIKKTKISVEGADVEISKVVLHWKGQGRHHHECRSREGGRTNG